MEKYKIIWKDIIEYWKEEKSFVFFSVCSIMLYFVSFLFCYGTHSWDKVLLTILTNGKIGILQGTILAGYLFVWHYGLEERRTSWQSLMVLGMNKRNILMVLQGEIMVFQFFAVFFAILFGIRSVIGKLVLLCRIMVCFFVYLFLIILQHLCI